MSGDKPGAEQLILQAAAELFHKHGVRGTGIDAILAASGTGKGQFYHYFKNKDDLVQRSLAFYRELYAAAMFANMDAIRSWRDLRAWLDQLVAACELMPVQLGCPVGSIAYGMDQETTAELRKKTSESLALLAADFGRAIDALKRAGRLKKSASTEDLARFFLVVWEGAFLLSRTENSVEPLKAGFNQYFEYLRAHRA